MGIAIIRSAETIDRDRCIDLANDIMNRAAG